MADSGIDGYMDHTGLCQSVVHYVPFGFIRGDGGDVITPGVTNGHHATGKKVGQFPYGLGRVGDPPVAVFTAEHDLPRTDLTPQVYQVKRSGNFHQNRIWISDTRLRISNKKNKNKNGQITDSLTI